MIHRLTERRSYETVRRKMVYLAWRKYRISSENAEDIVQNAVATYCEVEGRYAAEDNQYAILVGIFYKKCLEFIDQARRESRQIKTFCTKADAQRESHWLTPEDSRG